MAIRVRGLLRVSAIEHIRMCDIHFDRLGGDAYLDVFVIGSMPINLAHENVKN